MDASPEMMTRTQNRMAGHDDYTRVMRLAQPIYTFSNPTCALIASVLFFDKKRRRRRSGATASLRDDVSVQKRCVIEALRVKTVLH
jgi:hypothetical protein